MNKTQGESQNCLIFQWFSVNKIMFCSWINLFAERASRMSGISYKETNK